MSNKKEVRVEGMQSNKRHETLLGTILNRKEKWVNIYRYKCKDNDSTLEHSDGGRRERKEDIENV